MSSFDYTIDLFVGSWTDITNYVYDRGVTINMARSSETSSYQPATCSLVLNNRDGRFSAPNPTGPYYGSLTVNTPLRVRRKLITSGFSTNTSSAWPNTDTGEAWATFGAGGTLNASDYSSSGGVAKHSVPAANAYRSTYLSTVDMTGSYLQVDLSLDRTDITGAQVSWNVLCRGIATNDYYRIAVEVQTNESVVLSTYNPSGVQRTSVTMGFTHSAGQTLRLGVLVEDEMIRAKLWLPASGEPYDWNAIVDDTIVRSGWIGLQSRVDTGNTNTTPVVFSYDNLTIGAPRFLGEVADWPVQWDVSESDIYVAIEAAGVMRRVGSTNAPIKSPVRPLIPFVGDPFGVEPILYVPMEEGPQAIYGAPDIGIYFVVLDSNTKAPSEHWGRGDLAPWLYPGIALYGDGQIRCAINQTAFVPVGGFNGWRVSLICKSTGDQNWTWRVQTGTFTWQLLFKPGTKELTVTYPTGSTTADASAFFDNAAHEIRFVAFQDGANIDWGVSADDTTIMSFGTPGTLQLLSHWFVDSVAPHTSPLSVAHFAAWPAAINGFPDMEDAVTGFKTERVIARLRRLAENEGVSIFTVGTESLSAQMGSQSLSALSAQLDEGERTGQGFLYDVRGELGLGYRDLQDLYNQTARVTLSYAAKQLVPPLTPTKDDQLIRNDVIAQNSGGGQYRYSVTSGPMSTLRPDFGGVGRYTDQISVNTASDRQLQDVATWQASLGTVNEVRYPDICVNLSRSNITRSLLADLMEVTVGDRLQVNGIPSHVGGSTSQIVVGYEEVISRSVQEIRFHCVPASPYEVIQVDDSQSRVQAGSSFIAQDLTTSQTSVSLKSLDNTRWATAAANFPMTVTVGGEDMTISGITNTVPSFVSAGTAAHADNASVSPGVPAGSTTGDLLILFTAIRNFVAGASTPTGYTPIYTVAGNVRFFAKVHSGSESAPTVSFSGGSAGDTTSAQIIAIRNVGSTLLDVVSQVNGTGQNIDYPSLDEPMCDWIAIIWGHKHDDWTSVAPVSLFGATEIAEPSTTTGNDQGIVWDYVIGTGDAHIPAGTFAVTGGATAVSKGGVLLFGNWQTATVTRSVNGIVKAHTADGTEKTRVVVKGRTRVALAEIST